MIKRILLCLLALEFLNFFTPFSLFAQETPIRVDITKQGTLPAISLTNFKDTNIFESLPFQPIATWLIPIEQITANQRRINSTQNILQPIYQTTNVTNTVSRLQGSSISFEGTTTDNIITTFTITNPTTSQTITFPDASGEVTLLGQTINGTKIIDDSIDLIKKTTGDFVEAIASGSGINISQISGKASNPIATLGNLTSNWSQSGAYDIVLDNSASEIKILDSDSSNYATIDIGDLSNDSVFTLSGNSGTILTTDNLSSLTGALLSSNNLSDLTNGSTARTNLGLGTIATQSATNVSLDGGIINGIVIGSISSASGSFSTVNGLSLVTNNTGFSLSGGGTSKTLTINNSLNLSGTDGTTLTLPSVSDTLIGRTSTDTLTNKTLTSPTINGTISTSGLTLPGLTLSGNIIGSGSPTLSSLGSINGLTLISNTTGFTISGGTASKYLSLNNSLTLAAGADNQTFTFPSSGGSITVLGNTTTGSGSIVLGSSPTLTSPTLGSAIATSINGLTITNNGSNTLNIAANKNVVVNNSLTLTGTDSTTLTFPSSSDTLVGRATTDTLTNKTLTTPTINGTISTSGLTLPGFTLSGNVSGYSSPSISGLDTINGLTLTSNSTGFTLTGGTNSKSLTLNNSLILAAGSDNQTFTFPSNSGSITVLGNTTTGTGSIVLGTSPILTSPTLGTATTTTVNGLTITNNGSNTLNIAANKTFAISNSLTLAGTDNTTLTLPSASDTLIGRSSTDTLTNKTLTTPTINGTVSTSGLTLPGFTASGNITGSGSPVISSFGSINGLTLISNTTGFTISGGTASKYLSLNNSLTLAGTDSTTVTLPSSSDTLIGRTSTDTLTNKTLTSPTINGTVATSGLTLPAFTLSGAITGSGSPTISNLGAINGLTLSSSSIQPSNTGGLTIQSNGANALTLDAGGSSPINIGNSNATSVSLGNTSTNPNFTFNGSGTLTTGTGAITLSGDTTVSANKTLTVTTADNLTVGGNKIPQTLFIPVNLLATLVDTTVFVADASYQVTSTRCVYSVAALLSGTLQVRVETGTNGPGTGTAQLTSALNLSSTTNTVVTGTVVASPTTITAGDRISVDLSGTLTGLLGHCTIGLKRV